MMLRIILLTLCMLTAACSATGPIYTKANNPQLDYATLYIYRPSRMSGAARSSLFSLNGETVAKLKNNGYTWLSLKPAEYEISQEWTWLPGDLRRDPKKISIRFSVEAGESYYVRLNPTVGGAEHPNLLKLTDTLRLMEGNNPPQEINDCRFQKPIEPFIIPNPDL